MIGSSVLFNRRIALDNTKKFDCFQVQQRLRDTKLIKGINFVLSYRKA